MQCHASVKLLLAVGAVPVTSPQSPAALGLFYRGGVEGSQTRPTSALPGGLTRSSLDQVGALTEGAEDFYSLGMNSRGLEEWVSLHKWNFSLTAAAEL